MENATFLRANAVKGDPDHARITAVIDELRDNRPMAICHFCWENASLTKEHLLSRPTLETFGLDRSRIGIDSTENLHDPLSATRFTPLDDMAVSIACAKCNSGFLMGLEEKATRGISMILNQRADEAAVTSIERWLLTRLHWNLFAIGEGRRAFRDASVAQAEFDLIAAYLPDYERMHNLWLEEDQALANTRVGIARSDSPNRPSTFQSGGQVSVRRPRGGPDRAAAMFGIHLEGLVLEIVVCSLPFEKIAFRAGMRPLRPGARLSMMPEVRIETLEPKATGVYLDKTAEPPLIIEKPIAAGKTPRKLIHVPDSSTIHGAWVGPAHKHHVG